MKKLEKTNEQSLRYLKTDYGPQNTDHRQTDRQTRAITRDPLRRTRGPIWKIGSTAGIDLHKLAWLCLSYAFLTVYQLFSKAGIWLQFYAHLPHHSAHTPKQDGVSGMHSFACISIIMHSLCIFYNFCLFVLLLPKNYWSDQDDILHGLYHVKAQRTKKWRQWHAYSAFI